MRERRNYYYDSPFYYGLITWRKRLAIVGAMLIGILIYHGRSAPAVDDMWFWTGIIFGIVGGVCYIRMWSYECYLLAAMGPLDNNTVIGSLSFDKLERRHELWYEKKFGHKPPKTNTWSID
ncbi:hypothetical protein HOT49_gp279 [Erwinia phage vB_EamM_Alexandra]|uniref:Transmembrane protein n=1 Tax=Erwinia phage vB_EamM_Alexandra TaxID=2201424 RepID=A0A2Z4QE68_9CAUD|nr:hypothetical protein HOT49_gp279 [Erwinia phage vB_EamM_Alexandra]AWY08538.1 hypothetical protein Alexandra_281 [Erwinia phage vB_EamM_Alexandra]